MKPVQISTQQQIFNMDPKYWQCERSPCPHLHKAGATIHLQPALTYSLSSVHCVKELDGYD